MKAGFLEKLIERLGRIGPEEVQNYFLRLAQEKGFLETVLRRYTLEDWLQSRRESGAGIEGIIFVIPSEVEESLIVSEKRLVGVCLPQSAMVRPISFKNS